MVHTAKGGGIIAIGRFANYITRIIIAVILARALQPEQYGLYNLAISLAAVAGAIATFGLDTTVMRYIAIMRARKDDAGLWGVIQVSLVGSLGLSILTGTGLFALSYPLADILFDEPRLAPLLQIAAFITPALTMSSILAGATRGFKNMSDTVLAQNFIQPAVRIVLILILALIGIDARWAVIIFGLADLSASITLLFLLNKKFSLFRSFRTARRSPRELFGFTLPLWLSDMMITFRDNIQSLLIGSLGTISGVGIFAIANQVNLVGNIFHASITQSSKPLVAELHEKGDRKRLENLYQTATKWVVTLNLPMIMIVVLFPTALMSIFGKGFETGASALVVMAFANLVNVGTGMCASIIEMTGYTRLKLINSVIQVSVAILLNFLLIPRWGILGAAYAAFGQIAVANLLPLVEVWFLFKIQPYNAGFLKPVAAAVTAFAVSMAAKSFLLPAETTLQIIIHGVILLVTYFGIILAMGISPEDKAIFSGIRKKIAHRAARA